ncbi:hypothetical protein CUMW_221420 [Citrus unshiu]|uniref:Uncharacterized protein n=1 Tax=Citrus unshiu TaxID=55188 RepID=A0A2H5QE29_CITUN|nr:hypothetical protein CUMW_221420 [Citrus unshiu]
MTCKVLDTFYIVPNWLRSLSISNGNLLQLLEEVSWINALTINENVYPDLVKIFYSNMDTSAEKENRVITNVGGVLIEFDDTELNFILQTSEDGLEIYSARKVPTIDNFVHVDAVRNICRVPINEPSCKPCRSIGDEAVYALGFEWRNGAWVKYTEAKYTMLAPSDDRPLNSVVPADQLLDFSLPFWGQRRREDPPTCEPDHDASASSVPPADPHDSCEVILQQLMDKVMTLSVQQTSFQHHVLEEHRHLSKQHQQLLHGQRLMFEHFSIPNLFPPPAPPSPPPQ